MSAAEASTSSAKERKQALANGEAPEDHYNPLTTTTLFVSNLPYSATTTDLTTHFSDVGPVRSAFVVLDHETKKSKGVGFVSYAMREDAERAVAEMNGGSFGDGKGRRLGVEFAGKRPAAPDPESNETPAKIHKKRPALPQTAQQSHISVDDLPSAGPSDPNAIRTLVVSNLPDGLTKAVLWKKIRKVGNVEDLIYPVTEDNLSIAHVVFPTYKLAEEALSRLHAHTYKEHTLSCVLKKRVDKLEAAGGKDGGAISKGSRLIIRNLPWDTTNQTLHALFLPYGPIHTITLPPPLPAPKSASADPDKPAKPRARGFAFVWMLTRKDAEKALEEVNGRSVIGENGNEDGARTVAVDWALSKDKWKEAEKAAPTAVEAEPATAEEEDDAEESKEGEDEDEDEDADMMPVDEEEEEEEVAVPAKPALPPPEEGTTLFIRNLSFEATEDQLRTLFRTYGPLRYARITMDRATGRSRGTGFVCFWKKEDAERAVDQARLLNVETGSGANSVPVRDRTVNPFAAPTILTADPSSSLAASLVMHGRVLQVEFAVTREEASKLKEEAERRKEKVDKRNTYLMREGVIFPNTPAAATLPPVELEKRTESFNSRKTLLASNPSLYISKTRLSIRQLPLFCTERTLKRLAIHAVREFEAEVSRGEREGLDEDESRDLTLSAAVAKAEEKSSRGNAKPKGKKERQTPVIQAKVVRATDRVDPLTGLGKAKGYGFLEMRSHQDALRVLRWANNNPTIEALMREWFNVELGELVERTKSQLDEARLEELKETSSLEVSAPSAKKQRKGKGGATNNDDEDADDGEHPQPKKKERVESSELEIRLKRLQEKVKELTQAIEAGRNVVMKKTLIIEFSIENVQVVQRRVSKVTNFAQKRSREGDDEGHAGGAEKRRRGPKERIDAKAAAAAEAAASAPPTAEERKENKAKEERQKLGSLIGKKRRERKDRKGA